MKKKIGTSKSIRKYENGGESGPGKNNRTPEQKKYTSDSLSIAKNYNTFKTSKDPKTQNKAEDNLHEIAEKIPTKKIASMGPAGKSLVNVMKAGSYKKGGIVGTSKKPIMKMGGSVKKKMEMGGMSNGTMMRDTQMKKGGTVKSKTPAQKKFAALAPPKNKITFADKIAGAKKKK
jgi:hypothetical protein